MTILAPPAVTDPPDDDRALWLAVLSGIGTIQAATFKLPREHPLRDPVLSGLGTITAAVRRHVNRARRHPSDEPVA